MKKALVLQHMNHDHPGRFLDWFAEDNIIPDFVRLFEGASLPTGLDHDLLFVLGGEQNTWQEDQHRWLIEEKAFIREWVWERAKPYLGVCLGHQLLATALGGDVAFAEQGEVGVCEVALSPDGAGHPVFQDLPAQITVMQWHHAEVKRMPQSATLLASSATTSVQAMAIDAHALSTQFHCEFSPQTVAGWSSIPGYLAALERENGEGAYDRLKTRCYPLMPEMHRTTYQMWKNFKAKSGLGT